jgi:hypothetical protein
MFLRLQTLTGKSNEEAEMVVWAHFLDTGKVNFKGQYEAKFHGSRDTLRPHEIST